MKTWQELLKAAQVEAKAGTDIITAAGGPGAALDDSQMAKYRKHYAEATRLKAESDRAKAGYDGSEQARKDADSQALLAELSGSKSEPPEYGDWAPDGSGGQAGQFKSRTWSSPADVAGKAAAGVGRKGITEGAIRHEPVTIDTTGLPQPPTRFLELLPAPKEVDSNHFQYLRQVTRENNAAVVADGAQKPTSQFTWAEVEDRMRYVAHLSEPFPQRYLTDHAALTTLLQAEFLGGLLQAIEAELLGGSGTGEHIRGVLNTTGILSVEHTGSMLGTLRRARTRLEALGENPTGWVFHPEDLEELDLMREDGESGDFLTLDRVLGNLPRVAAPGVTKGTALLGDWTQVQPLTHVEGAQLTVHLGATELFEKNLVKVRGEQRTGLLFHRPQAVAQVALTAG